ncbi:MAG: AmmeMemoRadiSam system radical SAM enzyme [Candidatus Omnitrophica bacterium]|nr:AmmeMemoRadiSam system radical SAM enzyme [Candidatus Omnitrophota bacterium]
MRKEAMFYERLADRMVKCNLCAHNCIIAPQRFGICGVRQNIDGVLYSLVYGELIAKNIDPIEKKPIYHLLPGSKSYSIATIGCNFKCGFCQNWQISQLSKREMDVSSDYLSPEEVVKEAKENNCKSISYTYTEPTIFFEYAYDVAKLAKREGLYNVFVTNGYMRQEVLEFINPYLDAANVDLKSFRDDYYRKHCKAKLKPVLETIASMKRLGVWVEITTLVIPGDNDSEDELKELVQFIVNIDKDIPWHISRFYPNYKFDDYIPTPIETLRKAKEIGKSYGLKYVYLGNVDEGTDTYCFSCHKLLVKRGYFYSILEYNIKNGLCPYCGEKIGGIWG